MTPRRVLLSFVLAVGVVAPACSNDHTLPTVAEIPTTTDPKLAADLLPSPKPLPADGIVSGLRDAVTSKDFCRVLAAIDAAAPAPSNTAGVTAVYRALAEAATSTRAFLPNDPDLRTDWEVVISGTKAAAEAVEAHDGDITDPEVEAALESTDMVEAIQTVERYQLKSCPPPTAP